MVSVNSTSQQRTSAIRCTTPWTAQPRPRAPRPATATCRASTRCPASHSTSPLRGNPSTRRPRPSSKARQSCHHQASSIAPRLKSRFVKPLSVPPVWTPTATHSNWSRRTSRSANDVVHYRNIKRRAVLGGRFVKLTTTSCHEVMRSALVIFLGFITNIPHHFNLVLIFYCESVLYCIDPFFDNDYRELGVNTAPTLNQLGGWLSGTSRSLLFWYNFCKL